MLGLQRTGDIAAPMATAITRELTLSGSFRFCDEIDDVIRAMADGELDVDGIVAHGFPVSHALRAFEVAGDAAASSKVLLRFDVEDDAI